MKVLFTFFFISTFFVTSSQNIFERRIIIESDTFYAIEINRETQLAKLYSGNINEPIQNAKVLSLPAGNRFRNKNPQPFAWTMLNDTIYCINYLEFAQSSPVKSLKSIPLHALSIYDSTEPPYNNLMKSARMFNDIINQPLVESYKKYVYVDDLYFDIGFFNDTLYQVINVKNELDANITGSGNVRYKGNPSKVNSHAAGSGNVRKL